MPDKTSITQGGQATKLNSKPTSGGVPGQGSNISEASTAIWNKLSAGLKQSPSLHWQNALNTADELARSVCGQDIPEDLQADLIGNLNLLERTLLGLKIQSTNELPAPHAHIKDFLAVSRLNIVASSKQIEALQSLINNSSK